MIDTEQRQSSFCSHSDRETQTVRWISSATAVLVGLLAIAAFALSFEALRDLAVTTGAIPNPKQAWLFPVLLDGGVVVFSLAALRASLTGNDRRWYMTLVVVVTLFSVGFNVAHATRGFLSGIMAGMPPLLLFMAFESLMRQIQDSLKVRPAAKAKPRPSSSAKAPVQGVAGSGNREQAMSLSARGWSKARIAGELGVSSTTVSRYLRPSRPAPASKIAA